MTISLQFVGSKLIQIITTHQNLQSNQLIAAWQLVETSHVPIVAQQMCPTYNQLVFSWQVFVISCIHS